MVYAFSMPPTVVFQTKAEIALALLDEADVAGVSYSSNIMNRRKVNWVGISIKGAFGYGLPH